MWSCDTRSLVSSRTQDRFDEPNCERLGGSKHYFFLIRGIVQLSPDLEDFRLWLEGLRSHLSNGFASKAMYAECIQRGVGFASELAPFDEETLGGQIWHVAYKESLKGSTYAAILSYLRFRLRLMRPELTSTLNRYRSLPLGRFIRDMYTHPCTYFGGKHHRKR